MGEGEGQEAFSDGRGLTDGAILGVSDAADNDGPVSRATSDEAREAAGAAGPRIVYCGGCNPHIDRTAVAAELEAAPVFARPGATVYLSGCPRACASGRQLVNDDPAAAVVAGAHVDGIPTAAADIAAAVSQKLKE